MFGRCKLKKARKNRRLLSRFVFGLYPYVLGTNRPQTNLMGGNLQKRLLKALLGTTKQLLLYLHEHTATAEKMAICRQ